MKFEIARTSGHPEVDRIALAVGERAAFHPATSDGRPIRTVVSLPITLRLPDTSFA